MNKIMILWDYFEKSTHKVIILSQFYLLIISRNLFIILFFKCDITLYLSTWIHINFWIISKYVEFWRYFFDVPVDYPIWYSSFPIYISGPLLNKFTYRSLLTAELSFRQAFPENLSRLNIFWAPNIIYSEAVLLLNAQRNNLICIHQEFTGRQEIAAQLLLSCRGGER